MSPLPVALYARYSTDRQDARSIDDQLHRCRRFAVERGYIVVAEHRDAAQSGASLHRAGMQELLTEARKGKRSAFRAVLVDDLSRLSRDLGDTWNLVFGDLAAADVKVIDVTTGMASDGAGARLTFGALALVNDTFLQLVRTETHRGLEARARAGFWAGGICFGFTTELEKNPQDPERPRASSCIHPQEAELVRRIFQERASGEAVSSIAAQLNREGVGAPQDDSTKKRAGRGWSRSLLHFMLRNERYIGRFVWNKREWFRDPVTKRRRCRLRPETEWVVTERPGLAIVEKETWDKVQALHRRIKSSIRPPSFYEHMLSGQLICGNCGAPMSIFSRAHKNGRSWANYGCSARKQKGDAVCSNNRTVSELRIDSEVLDALQRFAESPEFERWVENGKARALKAAAASKAALPTLEARVKAQEKAVERIADVLVQVGVSDTLKQRLGAEEEKLAQLRAELARATTPPAPVRSVDTAQVVQLVRDVRKIARAAPRRAGKVLATVIEPVVLRPVEKGYVGDVWFRNDSAAPEGGRVCDRVSCGGRI